MRILRFVASLLVVLVLVPAAAGQPLAVRRSHPGALAVSVGDFNLDGTVDYAQSVVSGFAPNGGGLRVLSGADGAPLLEIQSGVSGESLGRALAGVGDVDGDGWPDIAAAAHPDRVHIFTGGGIPTVVATLTQNQPNGDFGWRVIGVGDIDGDQRPDVAVATNPNLVQIFSGATSAVLRNYSSGSGGGFGQDLAVADVDGDQVLDLIIGAFLDYVHVRSGATGALLHALNGTLQFGWSVDGVGDTDGDGSEDFVVGSPQADAAYVMSGATGTVLQVLAPSSPGGSFGWKVAGLGDVNGDGAPDVGVGGSPGTPVEIFDGTTGERLSSITAATIGSPTDLTGHVNRLGDVNYDGFDDFILGVESPWSGLPMTCIASTMAVEYMPTNLLVPPGGMPPSLFLGWITGPQNAVHQGQLSFSALGYGVTASALVVSTAMAPTYYPTPSSDPIFVDLASATFVPIPPPPSIGSMLPVDLQQPFLAGTSLYLQWGGLSSTSGRLVTSGVIGVLPGR